MSEPGANIPRAAPRGADASESRHPAAEPQGHRAGFADAQAAAFAEARAAAEAALDAALAAAFAGGFAAPLGSSRPPNLRTVMGYSPPLPDIAEADPDVAEAGPDVAEAGPDVAEAGPDVAEAAAQAAAAERFRAECEMIAHFVDSGEELLAELSQAVDALQRRLRPVRNSMEAAASRLGEMRGPLFVRVLAGTNAAERERLYAMSESVMAALGDHIGLLSGLCRAADEVAAGARALSEASRLLTIPMGPA